MQELRSFYTLETLAARLNRSSVGVRIKLRKSGRLPKAQYGTTHGCPLLWPVDVIEAAIAADPGLVLPPKTKGGAQ